MFLLDISTSTNHLDGVDWHRYMSAMEDKLLFRFVKNLLIDLCYIYIFIYLFILLRDMKIN